MPPKKTSKANPRDQYFTAIKQQKLDTLRWCMKHGGVTHRTEDEDGHTGLQIAAAGGFSEALEKLIEQVMKIGPKEDIDDADEDGRTPLMMAAYNGKLDCVRMLVLNGKANIKAVDEKGKTARGYAESRKHDKIIAFLDNPKAPTKDDDDEEEEEEAPKPRVFKASQQVGKSSETKIQEQAYLAKLVAADRLEKELAAAPKPVWPEVEAVIAETRRELSLKGKEALTAETGPLDVALWNCLCLFELRIELLDAKLTYLPSQIGRLENLTTLIVSSNALTALPDEVASLKKLKNLEAAFNQLTELPSGLAQLEALQVVDFSNNAISSLAPLSELKELVSLKVGHNQLTELPLEWSELEHMHTLAAPHNQIVEAPRGIGSLQMLQAVDLSHNSVEQIPIEWGNLTEKKLQSVRLAGNPLADPRIRRFVEQDQPSMVKDLLNHVRKNGYKGDSGGGKKGGGGGKKGKKGKGKAAAVEEPEECDGSGEDDFAAMLASINTGGDDSD